EKAWNLLSRSSSEKVNIRTSILLRVRIAFILAVLFSLAVIGKIAHIQFAEGKKWAEMGERISFDYKVVKATRGNIYSDNGSLLATSLPFYRVAFDATIPSEKLFNSGVDSLAERLSRFFGDKSKREYARMLRDARAAKRQYIVLNKKRIDYQDKKVMSARPIFREGRLGGGVIFEKVDVRYNPFNIHSRR